MNLEDNILIQKFILLRRILDKTSISQPFLWKENKEEATLATMYTVPQTHL